MPRLSVVSTSTPAPEPVALSPARQLLADRQASLARVNENVADQLALAAKLDHVHAALPLAKAALAAFDAAQSAAYAQWANGNVTGKPSSAGARRAELVAEVADAEAASTAATAAQEGFRQVAAQAGAPVAQLKAAVASAEKLVLIEDAELLLPQVKAAIAGAWGLHKKIASIRYAAASGADVSHNTEVGRALAAFDAARNVAEAQPREDEPERIFHLPAYAVEAAALSRQIMNQQTTYTGANPPL